MSNKFTISIGTLPAFQGRPEELKDLYLAIGYDNESGVFDVDTFNIRISDFLRMMSDSTPVASYATKGIVQLGALEERIDGVGPDGTPITEWKLIDSKDDNDYIIPTRKDVIQALSHCIRLGDGIDGQQTHIQLKELLNTSDINTTLKPREIGAVLVYNEDGTINTGSLVYRLSSNDKDGNARYVTFPSGTDLASIDKKIKNLESRLLDVEDSLKNKYDKTGGDLSGGIRFVIPTMNSSGVEELIKKEWSAISSSDAQMPSSIAGSGVELKRDPLGYWSLAVDNITVRKSMYVPTLVIDETRSIAGSLVVSPGHGVITSIEDKDSNWEIVVDGDEPTSPIKFEEGDFIRCSQYYQGTLRSYWLPIVGLDKLSKTILVPKDGDTPALGDKIVVFGNINNPNRQSLIVISGSENNSPSIAMYSGVNQNTPTRLQQCLMSVQGNLEGINSVEFGRLSGTGFYIRGNAYIVGNFQVRSNDGVTTSPVGCNKGVFDIAEKYYIGDECTYAGELWRFLGNANTQYLKGELPSKPLWLKIVSKGDKGESPYLLEVFSSNGEIFRNGNVITTLSATLYQGEGDITHTIPDSNFRWIRTSSRSSDISEDDDWNYSDKVNKIHRNIGKELNIDRSDVTYKATFICEVVIQTGATKRLIRSI